MKTKRLICVFLISTIVFSYLEFSNFSVFSETVNEISNGYEEENNLPDEEITEDVTPAIGETDVAFSEVQGTIEPLNIVPYSGISLMVTSTNSNIVAGVKQFQQYINANLPMTYLGTALVIDGSPGPATQTAAIKLIQYRLNQAGASLNIDGGFGVASQQAFTTYVGSINRYDTGVWVYILQGLLYCHDYNPQGFDGSYGVNGGTGLLNAVNAFKDTNKLTNDSTGMVGLEMMQCLTWKAPLRIIEDGVYFIKNNYSQKYLQVHNGEIANFTDVYQYSQLPSNQGITYLKQLWKIYYLGRGCYSVRPMHKLDMGLDVLGLDVVIDTIGTTDTWTGVPYHARWFISTTTGGFVFNNNADADKTMSLESNSTADTTAVKSQTNDGLARQIWSLEEVTNPPSGVIMYTQGIPWTTVNRWIDASGSETLSALELEPTFYSGTDISQRFTWGSNDETIAKVEPYTGTIAAINPGSTYVLGTKIYNETTYTLRIRVHVAEIEEGVYILQNGSNETYIDIEAQDMNSGTPVHQWQFNGGDTQGWDFVLDNTTGYFTISSEKKDGVLTYYMCVENNSSSEAAVVLSSSLISTGAKWRVNKTTRGTFVIKSQAGLSNGVVLSANSTANTNGVDLKQLSYIDDSNLTDEWNLFNHKDYGLAYIGTSDGDPYMPDLLNGNVASFNKEGYNGYSGTDVSAQTCLGVIKSSDVFACITHGLSDTLGMFNDTEITYEYVDNLPLSVFDDTKLVLFGACLTGEGWSNKDNLVNLFYEKGVDTVIGFTHEIYVAEANVWIPEFVDCISKGETILSALNCADDAVATYRTENPNIPLDPIASTSASYRYVCGNTNKSVLS